MLNRDLGRQNVFRERGQILWEPNAKLKVLLKLEGEENHSEIGVGKFFGTIPVPGYKGSCPNFAAPANCVDFLGYTDTGSNPFVGAYNPPGATKDRRLQRHFARQLRYGLGAAYLDHRLHRFRA